MTIFQVELCLNPGAKFIDHKSILSELSDHPSPVTPLPDITFEDEYTVQLGSTAVEMKYFGPNHGESQVVMRLQEENTLFVVDIVTPRRVAFTIMLDFWPDEWIR